MSAWTRLAIVNRGEAARRALRAVREYNLERGTNIETIALVTAPDRDAPFALEADRVVMLDIPAGKGAAAAYLDSERVLAACRSAAVEALWVGWGFAAEDAAFNALMRQEGLVFLGPSPDAMRLAGDKVEAKKLAERIGVPVVPWSGHPVATFEDASAVAERIGYPVILKASAGGGGRGIRVVEAVGEIRRAYDTASTEAERAFGDGRLFVERCVMHARHLEVQVAGDSQANVVALGVRDCTIQRRHQKLVEESPGPMATPALAAQLERHAVAFARAANYESLGTVEFIYDCDTAQAYFMEMNARIQVEHPVTELVFGVDLVKLQLDIARGVSIEDLKPTPRGAAIEVRLNAEDPDNDFAPAPGRVKRFDAPQGSGVRVDAGVVAGSNIPADFDSMIAKIMCWGKDRSEALARLRRALGETAVQIERGATNKSLLARILAHPDFVNGNITTRWLDRERSAGTFDDAPYAGEALLVGAVLAYGVEATSALAAFQAAVARGVPQSYPDAAGREVSLEVRGARANVRVLAVGHAEYRVRVNGLEWALSLADDGAGSARVELGGRSLRVYYEITDSEIALEVEGTTHRVRRDGGGMVRATSPCLVIDIAVKEGDLVKVGDRLASVEAMKMEMPIIARAAGRVTKILATANTHAAAGAPLLVVSPVAEGGGGEAAPREAPRPAAAPAADRLEALIDENGKLRGDVLEDTHTAGRKGIAEALRAELTRVFCGFDADEVALDRLQAIIGSSKWGSLKHPASYVELARALVAFVDVERLFSSSLLPATGPGPALSMQMGFYAYCRRMKSGTTGAPAELTAALTKALSHYGITDFAPNERLAQTLLRLTMAHSGPEARVGKVNQLASSLLKVLMQLHRAGADFSRVEGLEGALAELPVVVGRKYVFVADNAYQARYLLFQQGRFERRPAERVAFVTDALVHLGSLPKSAQTGAARELARTREPIAAALAQASFSKDASVRRWALEVLHRRLYDLGDDVGIEVQRPRSAPTAALLTAVSAGQTAPARLLCSCDNDGLAQALRAVTAAADALTGAVEADVIVQGAKLDDTSLPAALKEAFGAGGPARVTLIATAGDELRYRTFARDQGFADAEPWGALHPEAARRMELWRLGAFELTEVSAQENLVVYHGRARSNPKDQRLFVQGEIRHVPEGAVRADDGGLTVFDYAYFEAVRALREAQGRRTVRERLYGNRIILHLGPVLVAKRGDFMKVAEQLSAHRGGLGLESVTVRARMAQGGLHGAPVDTEIHVYNPTGHKLEVRVDRPSSEPIAAATEYELKVVKARALDMAYPYEVVRMLTSDDKVMAAAHFPAGRFVEYDLHPDAPAPRAIPVAGRPYGENRAGVVFGLITHQTAKYPDGMERVILLSDPLKGLGSLAEPECARIMAAIDLAAERQVPVEWVPISSGAHIAMDSGTENLDWTAAVLRKVIEFTQKGGEINVIVDGINVGAQSYFNAEATMLMHTKGVLIQTPRGAMVLTGKKALDYSGGVSAEDERGIGGFERVMGPNGQAQYFARDLGHAFLLLFQHYEFTYKKPGEQRPRPLASSDPAERDAMLAPYPNPDEGFTKVGDVFSATHNGERKKPFGMRALMDAVMDQDGGSLERAAFMRDAEIAIVRDCHLGGEPVCLIGVESRQIPRLGYVPGDGPDTWTGGTFFPQSSKKVARAINAASGNRPVVVLANLSGFDGSPESMRKWQLEYGAEIGRAVVNFEGPIVFCVVARYHGGAYVVFSKALNPNLKALALEGSYASVIGGAPAAAVVFSGQVRAETEKDDRVKAARKRRDSAPADEQPTLREEYARVYAEVQAEKQAELARAFDRIHSVERACEVGSLDEVLAASNLRQRLAELVRREAPAHAATLPPKVVLAPTAPALRLSTPPITALPASKN